MKGLAKNMTKPGRCVFTGVLSIAASVSMLLGADFVLPVSGCPRAHCNPQNSGQANAVISDSARIIAHDPIPGGSASGLGCSSNGISVVCAYENGVNGNLVMYDASGNRTWASTVLDSSVAAAAPIISTAGEVIAADDTFVARFTADGSLLWKTRTPGGIAISPVIVNGVVLITATHGPISAYSIGDGTLIGVLQVTDVVYGSFDTANGPAVIGNRVFVAMQALNNKMVGRLVAIDVDPNSSITLQVKWSYSYAGPTGGSPLVIGNVIYFDGGTNSVGNMSTAYIYAVQDRGDSGSLVWKKLIDAGVKSSLTKDPRSGFWFYSIYRKYVIRLDSDSGVELQRIDLDALAGGNGLLLPSSVITIASTSSGNPAMIIGVTSLALQRGAFVCAVNLNSSTLIWKLALPTPSMSQNDWTSAQFPVMTSSAGPIVVFTTHSSGAYFVGQ